MTDNAPDTTSDVLHGVREIAKFLNVTDRVAQHWIDKKLIPVSRKGRSIVARRSRLLEAFDAEIEVA
jgi:hypothetical protein